MTEPTESPASLDEGRAQAARREYVDLPSALLARTYQWQMIVVLLGLVIAVLTVGLVRVATAAKPAYITHLGQDGLYTPGIVDQGDVGAFALEFVQEVGSLFPEERAVHAALSRAATRVHPDFVGAFQAASFDLAAEVLATFRTQVFLPLDTRVLGDGPTGPWTVHIKGRRTWSNLDEVTPPKTFCYRVEVGTIRPSVDHPSGLAVTGMGEPGLCTDAEFAARSAGAEGGGR